MTYQLQENTKWLNDLSKEWKIDTDIEMGFEMEVLPDTSTFDVLNFLDYFDKNFGYYINSSMNFKKFISEMKKNVYWCNNSYELNEIEDCGFTESQYDTIAEMIEEDDNLLDLFIKKENNNIGEN